MDSVALFLLCGHAQIWLYFLEGYDCDCLSFMATTMFMPERMKEVSSYDVKGDLLMTIVRDDCTMLCGSEEPWSVVYMSHTRSEAPANEAYVGVTLRLQKMKDGEHGYHQETCL